MTAIENGARALHAMYNRPEDWDEKSETQQEEYLDGAAAVLDGAANLEWAIRHPDGTTVGTGNGDAGELDARRKVARHQDMNLTLVCHYVTAWEEA